MRSVQHLAVLSLFLIAGRISAQFGAEALVYPFTGSARLEAVDVDSDGDRDLLGVFDDQHVKWFENVDGAGNFGPEQAIVSFQGQCSTFGLADVDGDNDPDITLLTNDAEGVQLLRNVGAGAFEELELIATTTTPAMELAAADLNGDGLLDLLTTQQFLPGPGFSWFPGTATGFDPAVELPGLHTGVPSTLLLVGDIDLSGGLDVIFKGEDDVLLLAKNTAGDASVWDVVPLPIPAGPPSYPYRTPQLIDVDADGDLDLAESRGPAVHWLRNDLDEGGELSFVEVQVESWTTSGNGVFGPSPCGPGAAVVFVPANPALPVRWNAYLPLLNGFSYSNDLPQLPRGADPMLADLNGDGKDDLVLLLPNGVSWFPSALSTESTELVLPVLDTLCVNGPATELPTAAPSGGRWYGQQISNNMLFRANIGATMDLPVVHAAYAEQGCPLAAATSIRLIEGPVITSVVPSVICSADAPIQLTSEPASTEWFGLDGSSLLDPALFNGGYIVCEYTDVTGRMCSDVNGPIVRWTTLAAEIGPAGPFCTEDDVQTIVAAAAPPFGVDWSGDISGSTSASATFDPSQGPGNYVVILSVYPVAPNQCANSDTLHIRVGERPTITFTEFPVYCSEGVGIPLIGATPDEGVWSGSGVANGLLEPNVVGPGVHLLTYFATTPEGCGSQATTTIELIDATTVTKHAEDLVYCSTQDPVTFSATPSGGIWDAPITPEGLFDPATLPPGSYPIRYTYTDPRGCALENEPMSLEIGTPTTVTMEPVGTLCTTTSPIDLMGSISGVWSGAVFGEGQSVTFDPAAIGPGTWTVTLTASLPDECPGAVSQDIVVDICAGVEEAGAIGPTLSPNPFTDGTALHINAFGHVQVDVLDATGRSIRSTAIAAGGAAVLPIDLREEPAGLYVVRITRAGRTTNLRAIKGN